MAASAGEGRNSFVYRICSLEIRNAELLQKVQQLEKYSKGTLCTECIYHTAWKNENWDVVHWCKAHKRQVTEDDFCSMGNQILLDGESNKERMINHDRA